MRLTCACLQPTHPRHAHNTSHRPERRVAIPSKLSSCAALPVHNVDIGVRYLVVTGPGVHSIVLTTVSEIPKSPTSPYPQKPLDRRYTYMIMSVMLARQVTPPRHSPNQANSFPRILLQTLCRSEKSQVLWNQANPHSFDKTPGVGVSAFVICCTEAQKCRFLSPLAATLTHSLSRKSFACHSYENTRDGVPLRSRHPLLTAHYSRFVAPLFSYSYELLFPQRLCFHNHPHCPGVRGTIHD